MTSDRKSAPWLALERKSRQLAQSNADLEQFAVVASHELREPLRIITNYIQLLGRRCAPSLDDKTRNYIAVATEAAGRMTSLLDDLRAVSRINSQEAGFVPVNLSDACDAAIGERALMIRECDANVSRSTLPVVMGDASQFDLLFRLLIENAIKFRSERRPVITIDARRDETDWIVSVKDNGIGIEPQYFEKVFTLFQRLHTSEEYPGTGIGLSICRRVVTRHGGKIWVESSAGSGSTVFFSLPDWQGSP
jgi:light-regulated signal transduction histidine kinase (bacteriophytochrome)